MNIDYPYKLCEFKPAYGFLFEEVLDACHFWGQGDLEVIFGDIRAFIIEEMLTAFDFISLHNDYSTDCFALSKNTEQMNTFFKKSQDYKQKFLKQEYINFDEYGFAFHELHKAKSKFEVKTVIESFTHLVKKAKDTNEIEGHFDFILLEDATDRVSFDNGRISTKTSWKSYCATSLRLKQVCFSGKASARPSSIIPV